MREYKFDAQFNDIEDYLNDLFENDEKAKRIFYSSGFNKEQKLMINQLIIAALKTYHLSFIDSAK